MAEKRSKEEVELDLQQPMSRKHPHKSDTPTPILALDHAGRAFAVVEDEIRAVPEADLLTINLDIPRAAGRGALAAERIIPLLPALSGLPDLELPRVKRLGLYALALHHAYDLATEAGAGDATLRTLLEEAWPLREGMLRSAELMAHFGVFSTERVAAIRSGQGHADTADDVIALGRLFDEEWSRVTGKVPVTRAMVDRAPVLGAKLHKALAQREVEASPLVPSGDRRHVLAQAFTVFVRAYDQTRRGVTYLRWDEGDADKIVPSLYPHRPRRSGGEAEHVEDVEDVDGEVEDVDGEVVASGNAAVTAGAGEAVVREEAAASV